MASVLRNPGMPRRRATSRKRESAPVLRRILKWLSITVVATLFVVFATLVAFGLYFSQGLPAPETLADYAPPQVTIVLSAEGKVIGEVFTERRTVVATSAIPQLMIEAVLAAEDARFYEHKGLDFLGMLRAFYKNVMAGAYVQGGSTITQQVVKTFLLSPEKTIRRKAYEVLLARRLEEEFSKDEILYLYLNQIYFGHGRYGIEAAARYYFDKGVANLEPAEAALLAALPKAPSHYSPFVDAEKARDRRNWVLEQMNKHGFLDDAALAKAKTAPIPKAAHVPELAGAWPEIVDAVRAELEERFGDEAIPILGATVYTTIRVDFQIAAVDAVITSMRKLDRRRGYAAPRLHLTPAKAWKRIAKDAAKRDGREPLLGEELKGVVVSVGGLTGEERAVVALGEDLAELALAGHARLDVADAKPLTERFRPGAVVAVVVTGMLGAPYLLDTVAGTMLSGDAASTGRPGTGSRLGGLLPAILEKSPKKDPPVTAAAKKTSAAKKRAPKASPPPTPEEAAKLASLKTETVRFRVDAALGPQAAFVAMDVKTREIVAMIGGAPYTVGGINRVIAARRPPGSAFKPILYTTAIASRLFSPATVVSDAPVPFADGYDPGNAGREAGELRLRVAMTRSVNTVAVRVLDRVGEPALAEMTATLGIPRPPPAGLSAALGTLEVSPLELCNAYAVLASGGRFAEPLLVARVVGTDGEILYQPELEEPEQVIEPEVAYLVTSMMQSVVEEGTGRAARIGRPVAGKTGTTNGARSLWFGGFTPELVAVAFVGHDRPAPIRKEFGGTAGAPIWREFMKAATADTPVSFFPRPPGVVTVRIDPETGLRAYDGQANALEEVFIAGTEPTEIAPLPDSVSIDDWAMGGGEPESSPATDEPGWGDLMPGAEGSRPPGETGEGTPPPAAGTSAPATAVPTAPATGAP